MDRINDFELITEKAKEYLAGACLDKIVVYSVVVQLCFMAPNNNSYIWISACGDCFFDEHQDKLDFFENRKYFIKEVYGVMGRGIESIGILPDGSLRLYLDNHSILFSANDEDSEIIWSITSDTPAPFENHRFSISLVEGGAIYLQENND